MKQLAPPLLPFEKNMTSQFGEDGVLARALEIIGDCDRWCVEFGAWDGKYASNTYSLIENAGYSAVMIEADLRKYLDLLATHGGRSNVISINKFVDFDGPNTLDLILRQTPIPANFDVLSIDIDGNDYHIWNTLQAYRPKVVVIEFNPTIPNEVDFVQPRDMRVTQGASISALYRLAQSKGYRMVHVTTCNCIFVDETYFSRFDIEDDSPAALRTDLTGITYLFQTFDGKVHLAGNKKLLWHGLQFDESQIQVLPNVLQTYPPNYTGFQRLCWRGFNRLRKWKNQLIRCAD